MSTRSGKRIHGSFHENTTEVEDEVPIKSSRKTRSKRLKENFDEEVPSTRKRHYVGFPKDEDINENTIYEKKSTARAKKDTLKEQNLNLPSADDVHSSDSKSRTRHTRTSIEDIEEVITNKIKEEAPKNKKKSKKNKKKKTKTQPESSEKVEAEVQEAIVKKTKKKSGKQAVESDILNRSNGSVDSFHSAAGSPVEQQPPESCELPNVSIGKSPRRDSKRKPEKIDDNNSSEERSTKKPKKAHKVDSVTEGNNHLLRSKSSQVIEKKDATFDRSNEVFEEKLNTTFEKEPKSTSKSSVKNTTFDKSDSSVFKLNSTYEKVDTLEKNNLTFEKDDKSKKTSVTNTTIDKQLSVEVLINTFEKINKSGQSFNSTYDKETKEKLDSEVVSSKKSSLISSDGSTNLTFDKSNDYSRISIISDDSAVENIVNATPVLIESSMDESQRLESSKDKNNSSQDTKKLTLTPESPKANSIPLPATTTPLKREGTFTKDGPDVILMSPKPKLSSERTPVKRMSLPSPGCTPFYITKSSQKEKNALNLTHSIEKSGRRSSLVQPMPRTTKVMFCSPVNNPAVVMQQKRKVIKSNLKGSNKSFVFEESAAEPPRSAARKRSYTQGDAEEARAKRSRLGDALQASVSRLSRPRTVSTNVKLSEPSTPSKKQPPQKSLTPSKGKSESKQSRTKLPNFAALHQKQFDCMESLDECQQRRAKRAKELLTPTGAVAVLDRSSCRTAGTSITEPLKTQKESAKKIETPTKAPRASTRLAIQSKLPTLTAQPKLSTLPTQPKQSTLPTQTKQSTLPAQSKSSIVPNQANLPTLPALESLRPGFTRFGFKMNTDFNPFSIPPKTDNKPKENKPLSLMKRQLIKPSLNGATRRDVAKSLVMREKSFTSLTDTRHVKRKENRTIIKGVRTNRRFELQMQMRNVNDA